MIQEAPAVTQAPRHLVTDEEKINHLTRQVKSYENLFRNQQEYISLLQRNHASIQSEALTAQLEVNQTLTEQILYLEEQLDAAKQRNS